MKLILKQSSIEFVTGLESVIFTLTDKKYIGTDGQEGTAETVSAKVTNELAANSYYVTGSFSYEPNFLNVAWYDSSHVFIEGKRIVTSPNHIVDMYQVTPPANAAFVKFASVYASNVPGFDVPFALYKKPNLNS